MIFLGADHGGFELKEKIKGWLREWGQGFEDMGNFKQEPSDDYPDFAHKVAASVREGDRGVLMCRTGHGMAMAANRNPDIRAVLATSPDSIKRGREDENANVLVIPADFTTEDDARVLVKTFLESPFTGQERHIRRINKING